MSTATQAGYRPRPYHHCDDATTRGGNAAQLADLLLEIGPDAPTLCAGWTTRDLAAHLVVRERRPDAMVGVLIPPLAGHGEHVRKQKAAEPYDRGGRRGAQPALVEPGEQPADRRAGQRRWSSSSTTRTSGGPRPAGSRGCWTRASSRRSGSAVRLTARLGLRRLRVPLLVRAPGFGEVRVGGDVPQATLTGEPGELALFVSGRQRAARVDIDAPPETAEALRTAKLGI